MSGFIATNNSAEEPEQVINNGFFPDINVSQFRTVMRVDQTVTSERTVQAIQDAMITINNELQAWQNNSQSESLSDIPSENYGDKTKLEHLYQAALFNRAKGLLIESYRDYDSTKSGHDRADEMETRIDDYLRRSREAIRNILGISRMTVELI